MHTQTINQLTLENYINKCITDAANTENRPNDVRYEYLILDKYLVFACKSGYQKVIDRLLYRLLNNLPKNFGLHLNVVIPDAIRLNHKFRENYPFDLYATGLDPNYSILPCTIFGKTGTIRGKCGNCIEGGIPHLDRLKKFGYDYIGKDHDNWKLFYDAYVQAYHMTPFDGWKKTKNHYENEQ